ncbi:MAG: hypothetical protein ACRC8S_13875, partial [Fimbriiglobus sp.]
WLPDIDFSLFSSEQPPGNCGGGKGLRRVGQQHNTLVRRHSYSSVFGKLDSRVSKSTFSRKGRRDQNPQKLRTDG